uniref:Putative secretion protein HlyD n=1 Tax=Synechocystis sp. PCC 9413 TaxID=77760 RepID=A0A2P0ZGG2_9SYNC|nr:putative secretion protein HlyD [Synechocystis sp. PCC 9413]
MSQTLDSPLPNPDESEVEVTHIDDWSDSTQELIDTLPKTWTRGLLYFLVIFMAIALPWAVLYRVDETGTARGRLEPKNSTQRLDTPASGTVTAVRVKAGDTVKRGQIMVELETDLLRNDLQQARDKLEGQQNRMTQLQSQKNAFILTLNTQEQQNKAQVLEKESQIDRAGGEVSAAIKNAPLQEGEKQAQLAQAREKLSSALKNSRLQEREKLSQIAQARAKVIAAEKGLTLQSQEKLSQIAQARGKVTAAEKALTLQSQEKLAQVELARQRVSAARQNLTLQEQEKLVQIERARQELSAAKKRYILTTTRLKKAISELERYNRLLAEGVVAQVKVIEIEQKVDENRRLQAEDLANIELAQKQVQEQERSYETLISQLRSDIEQAQKQLQEQQRSYSRLLSQLQSEIEQSKKQLDEQQRSYSRLLSQLRSEIQQARIQLGEQLSNKETLSSQLNSEINQAEKQLQEQNQNYQRIINQNTSEIQQARSRLTQEKRGSDALKKSGELALLNSQKQLQELEVQIVSLKTEINQTQAEIKSLNLQLQQRTIRATIDGIVTEMTVKESQSYLQAGQLVAQIAPQNSQLILRAQMPSNESGFLKVGLPVKVKFDAYPFQDYGVVSGKVTWVSPDSKTIDSPQGRVEFYELEVGLDRTYISNSNKPIKLNPGQTASAEVIIRQRRIIDFIIDPFKKLQRGDLKL